MMQQAGKLPLGFTRSFGNEPMTEHDRSALALSRLRSAVFPHAATISGFVFDPEWENTCFAVELLLDGWHAQLCRAELFSQQLAETGVSNAFHGFLFCLPEGLCLAETMAQIRIANTDIVLDQFGLDRLSDEEAGEALGPGEIKWQGGLRFSGWLAPRSDIPSRIRGLIDEVTIIDIMASGWAVQDYGPTGQSAPTFNFHLPLHFADGHVRRLQIVNACGEPLRGSPVPFVAFPDGLERFLEAHAETAPDALRGRLAEALSPQSMPFAWLDVWRKRFPLASDVDVASPIAVILMGEFDVEASLTSLERCLGDWIAANLTSSEGEGLFHKDQLLEFLSNEGASCEHIVFARAGSIFESEALQTLALALEQFPKASLAYGDVVVIDSRGVRHPLALPAFDYERLLEQGYAIYFFAMRRADVIAALSAGQGNLFHLLLDSCPDENAPERKMPIHLPGFLAECPSFDADKLSGALVAAAQDHLKQKGTEARVETAGGWILPSVHILRSSSRQRVSALVCCRDRLESLWIQDTQHELELIILESASSKLGGLHDLNEIEGRPVKMMSFKPSASLMSMLHEGAAAASGDYLLFLDHQVELADHGTIDELMSRQARPDVGAVGPCLTWPGGTVRDAGAILGPNFSLAPSGAGYAAQAFGFADMLAAARECSALSTVPFLTRRDHYLQAGGLDHKTFPHVFAVADYCLRQTQLGRRTVVTPRVKAVSHGKAKTDCLESTEAHANFTRELAAFRHRWGHDLMRDPYYNPCLSLDVPFSALAWPPRNREARFRDEIPR
jgi:O-antigen biosynthesis protein